MSTIDSGEARRFRRAARAGQAGAPLQHLGRGERQGGRRDRARAAIATGSHSPSPKPTASRTAKACRSTCSSTVRGASWAAVDLPVTVDFEGGFAVDAMHVADHARYLAETGAVGCNFEDQEVGGPALHPIDGAGPACRGGRRERAVGQRPHRLVPRGRSGGRQLQRPRPAARSARARACLRRGGREQLLYPGGDRPRPDRRDLRGLAAAGQRLQDRRLSTLPRWLQAGVARVQLGAAALALGDGTPAKDAEALYR